MTHSQQVEAFQNDINAVCKRYLDQFDIYVEEMVYALECESMMLMVDAVRQELEEEDDEGFEITPA